MDVTGDAAVPPLDVRTLGRTGFAVTAVSLGTSPLAMPTHYGASAIEWETAVATVTAALDSGIRSIDTSNGYGDDGGSERVVGEALRRRGGLPPGVLLATKVDPHPVTGDFSGARVRESFEESLDRLGVDRIELLHLHDPERIGFEAAMAPEGPVAALLALRREGRVDRLGVAGGSIDLMRRLVATDVFDAVLNHSRYTLLDRSAESLFAFASERGIGVLNAAPYGGGLLAKGAGAGRSYAYGQGSDGLPARAELMRAACERHGLDLATVALQFSLRNRHVDTTVIGASRPDRIDAALRVTDVPQALWEEIEALVPPEHEWLH